MVELDLSEIANEAQVAAWRKAAACGATGCITIVVDEKGAYRLHTSPGMNINTAIGVLFRAASALDRHKEEGDY